MSYILNALRKAEQEHQAGEHPSWLNDDTVEHQVQKKYLGFWLVGVLILINLVTLSFFIGYNRPDVERKHELTGKKKEKLAGMDSNASEMPLLATNLVTKDEGLDNKPDVQQKSENKAQESFAEIVTAGQVAKATRTHIPHEREKQQPVGKITRQSGPVQKKQVRSVINKKPDPVPLTDSSAVASVLAKPKSDRKNLQDEAYIPGLKELPLDFRRKVPEININVYVYSEDVAERFVVVDMVKYTADSMIAENMRLQEIQNDSLVVEYLGKIFRIMRP
jgi:general secretion pathway protein B